METQDTTPESLSFTEQVQEALSHFYDHARLLGSPLLEMFGAVHLGHVGAEITSLRRELRQGIDALRPPASVRFGGPEWLSYEILLQRYIHRRGQHKICDDLAISRTSYYRYHRRGIEALTTMMRKRLDAASPHLEPHLPAQAKTPGAHHSSSLLNTARRIARQSNVRMVDGQALLAGIMQTLEPLAAARGVALSIEMPKSLPPILGSAELLRQTLLSLLDMIIAHAQPAALSAQVLVGGGALVYQFSFQNAPAGLDKEISAMEGFMLAQVLLHEHGGSVSWRRLESVCFLECVLPASAEQTVLIIDDDVDTIALYRRWLQVHGILSRSARTSDALEVALSAQRPESILLDVLMPNWDGWAVLQQLKASPHTADIPVVICSVLSQPQLALTLGAAAVMKKPILGEELLFTLREIWAQRR